MPQLQRLVTPPPADTLHKEGAPFQLPASVIAQGWRADDDTYYEEIRYPSGAVVWYELQVND